MAKDSFSLLVETAQPGGSNYLKCHKCLRYLVYGNILIPRNGKMETKRFQDVYPLCPKDLFSDQKYKGFSKFIKENLFTHTFQLIALDPKFDDQT